MTSLIKGLAWLGTRTDRYEALMTFYRDTMGLELEHQESDFAVFGLPDGSKVEVFGPSDESHAHFDSGPVGGFLVGDIDAARAALDQGGAEFFGPVQRWEPTGDAWAHFRAPDGNVYELTQPGSES
ncbi:MAG: VOC family protein [Actinobacteria bacterium]|nr:VOC family protein [Actinomycetota bacterium]